MTEPANSPARVFALRARASSLTWTSCPGPPPPVEVLEADIRFRAYLTSASGWARHGRRESGRRGRLQTAWALAGAAERPLSPLSLGAGGVP